jgi:hypothetical protein
MLPGSKAVLMLLKQPALGKQETAYLGKNQSNL